MNTLTWTLLIVALVLIGCTALGVAIGKALKRLDKPMPQPPRQEGESE